MTLETRALPLFRSISLLLALALIMSFVAIGVAAAAVDGATQSALGLKNNDPQGGQAGGQVSAQAKADDLANGERNNDTKTTEKCSTAITCKMAAAVKECSDAKYCRNVQN